MANTEKIRKFMYEAELDPLMDYIEANIPTIKN